MPAPTSHAAALRHLYAAPSASASALIRAALHAHWEALIAAAACDVDCAHYLGPLLGLLL